VGCCGQGREALRSSQKIAKTAKAESEAAGRATTGLILEYVGRGSYFVRGSSTGTTYLFRGAGTVQTVHPGDVSALVGSRLFRPVG
jgi:hypothetical protein